MNHRSTSVAVLGLRWVLGLVILLESAHFALGAGAAREVAKIGLPNWIPLALGGGEAVAALFVLAPAVRLTGGYALLFILAIAVAVHLLHGQYDVGSLLVYGMAVYVCMNFRESVEVTVVLAKPDPIDNMGVAVYTSIPVGAFIVRSFGRCFRFLPEPGVASAGSPPSTRRSAAVRQTTQTDAGGSLAVGLAMCRLEQLAIQRLYRQSRDRDRLAPERLSLVLGLEGPTR